MLECEHCVHKPTISDNIERHKYLMYDGLVHKLFSVISNLKIRPNVNHRKPTHENMKYLCDQCNFKVHNFLISAKLQRNKHNEQISSEMKKYLKFYYLLMKT